MLDRQPTVVLFDANGILHPYRCGMASQIGVTLDIATVGVAKHLLYGTVEKHKVFIDNELRGYAVVHKKGQQPIYVSPGNKISLETSYKIVKHLQNYKIPEPLRLAHHLSKQTLQKRG